MHKNIELIIQKLREITKDLTPPLVDTIIVEFGHDPYLILISCLLSLRAKDSMTIHVCRDLFGRVRTPKQMLTLSRPELEKIVFKTGFYITKARVLHEVSHDLLMRFGGKVPESQEQLLSIKGVGLKTANLVMGLAFGEPRICVDVHVHRISNRLGLIKTKTPEETELALMAILPKEYWIEWNKLLVMWGQNVCVPVSPWCSRCPLKKECGRVGVGKSR